MGSERNERRSVVGAELFVNEFIHIIALELAR